MSLPMQIVSEKEIAKADSLFRVGLEHRMQNFAHMTWEERLRLIGYDMVHVGLKIVVAVAIIIVGRWLVRRLARGLDTAMNKWKIDPALHTFIRTIVKTLFYFVLFYIMIAWLGINTSLFVALFAAAGLAIGMAMSGVFQNIAGGVMILVLKPFSCGDWIELEGQAGKVMDVHLFNTVLRTADNRTILLPNGGVFTSVVSNHTSARTRRLEWPVSLELGTDFDAVQKVLLELVASDKRIHTSPVPEVLMVNLDPGSMDVLVRGWVETADYWDVFYKINSEIYKTLPASGFDLESAQSIRVTMQEPDPPKKLSATKPQPNR